MLNAFVNSFRTPDLRKKILFTLSIIALTRVGSVLPTPGVDVRAVKECLAVVQADDSSSIYQMVNLLSGGALLRLSVLSLGIMPYITASIILQLLTVVIPRLEALRKEGQSGTAKITQYTRYLTVGLAILQSTTMIALARNPGQLFQGCSSDLIPDESLMTLTTMVVVMVTGTAMVMWFGELITERGVGNGMSVIIFTSIAAGFPTALWAIKVAKGWPTFLLVVAIGLVIMGGVIFMEQAQRRIPVQYARRMVGTRALGGNSTYIPLKVNQAGVIPVIFASSLLYLPVLIAQFNPDEAWSQWISRVFVTGDHPLYMLTYLAMIIFFTYFYVSITFNPEEVADNMKKYGGFIPGIRAGRPTQQYLSYVLSRITLPGALYLGVVSMIPIIALVLVGANQNFPFGGTSILIMVGVGLDTVKQIESQLQQRRYEGFLR